MTAGEKTMRNKVGILTVISLAVLAAHASYAQPIPALESIQLGNGGSLPSYSLGWEFTPKTDIVVTDLGYYAVGATLTFDHTVTIYDKATGDPKVSGVILGDLTGTPTPIDPTTRYAFVDVSNQSVQLNAGTTYVIASHWLSTNTNWFDADVQSTSGYVYADSYITLGALGLSTSSTTPCMPSTANSGYTFLGANFKFEVAPSDPAVMIENLVVQVAGFNLQQGIDNSLDAKLAAALDALQDVNTNNDASAVNKLEAFISEVEAQREKKITNEQADELIAQAQAIIALLTGT
jgi:hypothetical protein